MSNSSHLRLLTINVDFYFYPFVDKSFVNCARVNVTFDIWNIVMVL